MTIDTDLPLVLTSDEVASILRISRSHLCQLVRQGTIRRLPGMGRRNLITRDELRRYLTGGDHGLAAMTGDRLNPKEDA